MEPKLLWFTLFGLLAAAANILGGLILVPSSKKIGFQRLLKYLLALGAGFMLAVTFIEILPKTIALWQRMSGSSDEMMFIPMLLLLSGYLLTQFFEHTIAPHFHLGHHHHDDLNEMSAYSGISGLMIHSLFDGVAIAAASELDVKAGLLVFLAVVLHKFPEGFTVASMMFRAGKGTREVLIATSVLGVTTLAGILLFELVGANLGDSVAYALPLACGITLYVAASDLVPEVNHHEGSRPLVSLSIFAGVALFFLIHLFVHAAAE